MEPPRRDYTEWGNIGLAEYNPGAKRWAFRFEHCAKEAPGERSLYMRRERDRPRNFRGESMSAITCPYCNKTYSARSRLLLRLEMSPQSGNRNTEICPKPETTDSPRSKWLKTLLKIKGNVRELHTKKSHYRANPIIRLKIKERLQRKTQTEEPPTQDEARKEIPTQDPPTPQRQHQSMPIPNNQTHHMDYLQVPPKSHRKEKKRTPGKMLTQDAQANNQADDEVQ